jgi:hypothetical protein
MVSTVTSPDPNLQPLCEGIERAAQAQRDAYSRGEVISVLPMALLLDEHGQDSVWRLIATIKAQEPTVYSAIVGERNLYNHIVSFASETLYNGKLPHLVSPPTGHLSWTALLTALRAHAQQRWLVGIPLANLSAPSEYLKLSATAGVAATAQPDDEAGIQARSHRWALETHLGKPLSAGVRWREDRHGVKLDTRHTAMLAFLEDGSRELSIERASSRAGYVLALWCLLKPPSDGQELWPAVGEWEPQPFQRTDSRLRRLDDPSATEQGGSITEYPLYQLPSDEASLRAPFLAMEAALDTNHLGALHARAILSTAWTLYTSQPQGGALQRTDRLLLLGTAIEALCDIGQGAGDGGQARWKHVTGALGVWTELHGAYTQREINDARKLGNSLRDIAAHGSDTVLVNLDYPRTLTRRLPRNIHRTGEELSLARAVATEPILRYAVRKVALHLAQHGVRDGWNDPWFRSQLLP